MKALNNHAPVSKSVDSEFSPVELSLDDLQQVGGGGDDTAAAAASTQAATDPVPPPSPRATW